MPKVVTQADLLGHLREHCIEGVEDPFERIRSCISRLTWRLRRRDWVRV
jgi:hypothetical protein